MSDVTAATEAPASAPSPVIDVSPPPVGAAPVPEAPKDEPKQLTMDETLNAAWDKAQTGVDRAADGKFTNGKAAEPAPAEKTDSVVQPQDTKVETPVAPDIEPPHFWTAEAKAQWAKVPPELRPYVRDRDLEAQRTITSQGEKLKSFEPFEQVVAHNKDAFERRGIQPAQAFAVLLDAQRQLDANPIDGLVSIGLTYGIDLRPLLAGQQGALPAADPRVGQVAQEVNQLKQELKQHQQTVEQQLAAEADATLKKFAEGKPYYDEARPLMAALMKEGHAQTLEDAYDMAINASKSIRARIQADQRAAEEKKRQDEKSKADEEAKRRAAEAAKSAKANVRGNSAHPNPKTINDTLNEIGTRIYG